MLPRIGLMDQPLVCETCELAAFRLLALICVQSGDSVKSLLRIRVQSARPGHSNSKDIFGL